MRPLNHFEITTKQVINIKQYCLIIAKLSSMPNSYGHREVNYKHTGEYYVTSAGYKVSKATSA